MIQRAVSLLLALSAASTLAAQTPRVSTDPDSARLITSEVELFWSVLDRSPQDSLAAFLQREYLDRGTDGLRDFIPSRILSAEALAERIGAQRDRYDSRRAISLAALSAEPAIRAALRGLKDRYAAAVFPDVYFVVGRFNSGGTVSANGLLIGAEMQSDSATFPSIVAHELIHFQQPDVPDSLGTLLAASIMEGSADFVAELISGQLNNTRAHEYALPREPELWSEFRSVMHLREAGGWIYGGQPEGRPADLGYFFGYRIAHAYYAGATDKGRALREILTTTDFPGLLAASGYAPTR
jgi:hypothetical protein